MYGINKSELIIENMTQDVEILIVDDNAQNLKVLSQILSYKDYTIRVMSSGENALKALRKRPADLILLDINMPGMNGFEVCKQLKQDDQLSGIPVILITALASVEDKVKGFEVGAVDYITKPFMIEEVEVRVKNHLKIAQMRRMLEMENDELQVLFDKAVKDISLSHLSTVYAMVELAEARDDDTGKHIQRIGKYCEKLAELAKEAEYDSEIDDLFISNILIASPLHDIGKIGIRDSILLKPGNLDDDEFKIMRSHVDIGAEKLEAVAKTVPKNSYISMGAEIAKYHHERWDGSGYQRKLSGKDIPVSARIMAIADVYDALRSKRVYKEAFSHDETLEVMKSESGTQFDPHLMKLFLDNHEWFRRVFTRMSGAQKCLIKFNSLKIESIINH